VCIKINKYCIGILYLIDNIKIILFIMIYILDTFEFIAIIFFFCIYHKVLFSFFLFRFNCRSSVHGSLVGRKQRSGIRHFCHQRHSVFADSANASRRSSRWYVAASGFSGFHTSSGISPIIAKIAKIHKKLTLTITLIY